MLVLEEERPQKNGERRQRLSRLSALPTLGVGALRPGRYCPASAFFSLLLKVEREGQEGRLEELDEDRKAESREIHILGTRNSRRLEIEKVASFSWKAGSPFNPDSKALTA